jgi:hypothetical protein
LGEGEVFKREATKRQKLAGAQADAGGERNNKTIIKKSETATPKKAAVAKERRNRQEARGSTPERGSE